MAMGRQVDPALFNRLRDARGNQVLFLSHCLLDENVRYLGGAFHRGATPEAARLLSGGIGICQLPCPEQQAWGGVHKPAMMAAYGLRDSPLYRFRRPLFRLFVLYTRVRYRLLARRVAREISQYHRAGVQVTAVVGVGASPSCGVTTTLDIDRSFETLAGCPLARIDRTTVNRCVAESCIAGEGLFIRSLRSRLRRHGITPPFLEHDLIAEMQGIDQTLTVAKAPHGLAPAAVGTRAARTGERQR
jgi:predicted secreted protein